MEWLSSILGWETEVPSVPTPEPVEPPKPDNTLKLAYEAKPFTITQKWGVYAPSLYSQYGFTNHNGLDISHGINRRLRAPFDYQVYRTLWQPNGGGNVLSILSTRQYESPHGLAYVLIDYLHLDKYLKAQGNGSTGDLLALAGSSGVVYGAHTHIQHRWVRKDGDKLIYLDKNKANGSFDPMEFYTGIYAVDLA